MYAKIFSQIYDSSLVEDYPTRCVFMDLLILANRHGVVDMTPEAIARRTNAPIATITSALAKLSQPDPRSRTNAEDGRRIVLLDEHRDWGWQIVNFVQYHKMRTEEERNVYMRDYMRKKRVNSRKHLLTPVNTSKGLLAHVDVDADVDLNKEKSVPRKAARPPSDSRIPEFIKWFCERFKEVKGAEYVVVHGRDQKLVKQMLCALPPEELRERAEAMFEHPFWGIKAGLGTLLAHANEFIPDRVEPSSVESEAVKDQIYGRRQ